METRFRYCRYPKDTFYSEHTVHALMLTIIDKFDDCNCYSVLFPPKIKVLLVRMQMTVDYTSPPGNFKAHVESQSSAHETILLFVRGYTCVINGDSPRR